MPSLFASYLRVYEPLTAFDRDRQVFWRRYAREGRDLGLVDVLKEDDLAEDDSPGLVAAGLGALSRGDAEAATEAYEKLVSRWRAVQLLERCN